MRFAFAGIDFLGDVFQALIDEGWEPIKLFTRPCDGIYDFNEVTVGLARSLRLEIQSSRIRPTDLADLKRVSCDALVVAGYPWLVKDWETQLPYGINFHPSPLPAARGPYPLFQAILDRWNHWGMTAHALTPAFDTGAILAQNSFSLGPDETHDTLLAKCQMAAKDLASRLAADLPRLWEGAQPQSGGSYWPRITEPQRTLDWMKDVDSILRTVRAFGSIGSIAQVGAKRVYVWDASGWTESHRFRPGTLVHQHRRHLVLAARDGFIQLTGWSALPPEKARNAER